MYTTQIQQSCFIYFDPKNITISVNILAIQAIKSLNIHREDNNTLTFTLNCIILKQCFNDLSLINTLLLLFTHIIFHIKVEKCDLYTYLLTTLKFFLEF